MKRFAAVFTSFILVLMLSGCSQTKDVKSFHAMDTFMTVQSWGSKSVTANEKLEERILQLENLLSTTKDSSEIYRLNHRKEDKAFLSSEAGSLLEFSLKMADETKGALNPALFPVTSAWGFTSGEYRIPSDSELKKLLLKTDYSSIKLEKLTEAYEVNLLPGMMIDFGAVGKGFAGDEAIKVLKQNGIKSALLDLGGNIQALGRKPDGNLWKIGIKNPWDGTAACGISIENKAVITSGGYERFFTAEGKNFIHIFDGKTGKPVQNDIMSTTIICDSGLYGDALSTAIFVMGKDKAFEYQKNHPDFEMIIICSDKSLWYSSGIKDNLSVISQFSSIHCIE